MASFSRASTGLEVAKALASSIKGKTVLITGGTLGGLGAECAATLAKFSPKLVILTARSQSKIDETFESIRKQTPSAPLRSLLLDLSSMKDVRRAAKEVNGYAEPIDVLIHNAGVGGKGLAMTEEGLPLLLATNHLGPFLFTKLVLPKCLESAQKPRIVFVSSGAAYGESFNWDDPFWQKGEYNPMKDYGGVKSLNMLAASALARKSGWKVEAFSANPGWVNTHLSRHLTREEKVNYGFIDKDGVPNPSFRSFQEGISSYIAAGYDPKLSSSNGTYIDPRCSPSDDVVPAHAKGEELEDRMWSLSEDLMGEMFTI